MKKRIEWIDIAKYICIMVIMLEHLESGCDELSVLYTTCGVSMFFLCAGYVHKAGQNFGSFLVKKARTLLVPWLVFSFLDISLAHIVSFGEHDSYLSELLWNLAQIRQFHAQLWFIPALFASFIPFYFFVELYTKKAGKCENKKSCAVAFLAIALLLYGVDVLYSHLMTGKAYMWGSAALPWHADYWFEAMWYMSLGYFLRQVFEGDFDRLNCRRNRIILLAIYLCSIYYPYLTSFRLPPQIHELFSRLINPFMGCTLVCSYSKIIKSNRYFAYVGQNTLLYFAFHGKVLGFAQGVLKRLAPVIYGAILSNKLTSSVFAICFTLLMSFVLIVPSYIVNRFFPFLIGKPLKSQKAKLK